MHERPDLVSVGEAAEMSGLSVHSVRAKARSGALPVAASVGGRRLFRREDVEVFVERRRTDALMDRRIHLPERLDAAKERSDD